MELRNVDVLESTLRFVSSQLVAKVPLKSNIKTGWFGEQHYTSIMPKKTGLLIVLGLSALAVSCNRNKYEVVERSDKEVANFGGIGIHTEFHYVLLHDGHKFYTTCDWHDIDALDPTATCALRPLRTYECVLNNDPKEKDPGLLSDLKCKDDGGHNVYLYVEKKE